MSASRERGDAERHMTSGFGRGGDSDSRRVRQGTATYPGTRGGDSRIAANPNVRDVHEARKPRRGGSLLGDQPTWLWVRPWRAAGKRACAWTKEAHEGSRDEGRGTAARERPLEGVKPRRATRCEAV
jgi:hypothetical protein